MQAPDPALIRAFVSLVRRRVADQIEVEGRQASTRRETVLPMVRQGVSHARDERLCGRAWLFGSYAWGQPGERSDVDILVEGCRDTFLVASLVGRACGKDVHVIDWSDAPETLRQRAVTEGVVL